MTECINVCQLNDSGVCIGCHRTIDEITKEGLKEEKKMVDMPFSISYTEIVIMLGVWLNALINLYNFTNNRKKK